MNKPKLLYAGAGLLAIVAISTGIFLKVSGGNSDEASQVTSVVSAISIPLETVGQGDAVGTDQVGSSWPGEIISSGDVEVQPQREGTIVEWKVKIGQKVSQGQVLAQLSAPPATPELTKALAEQAQSLARAKAQASAVANFTEKNIAQLNTLRDSLQKNIASVGLTLNGLAGSQNDSTSSPRLAMGKPQSAVEVEKQNLRKIIEQILNKHIQEFSSGSVFDAKYFSYTRLKYGMGLIDSNLQTSYEMKTYDLIDALKDPDALPLEVAQNYMQAAIKLVNGSLVTEGLPRVDLDGYRVMVNEDQVALLEAIAEYKTKDTDYSLSQLEQEKDYAEKTKEIDQAISELEKELELAQAEVKGAEAAYYTISNALTGGLNITAPRAGIVSIITKQSGDFVNPGTAVASINSGNEKDRIVRFRIPGNITPPKAGEILTVIRPGFPRDGKKIILAGIGVSLDSNGSFLADADFIEPVDWPVHASVRVLASAAQSDQALVSLSAVWWDDDGHPTVWLVTEENKIRPQEVKTGRTLGDKIEILEGLAQGSRIVSKATSDLKAGMQLDQLSSTIENKIEEETVDESQPHAHDE